MPNFKSINRVTGVTIAINIDYVTHFETLKDGGGKVYLASPGAGGGPYSIELTKTEFEIFIKGSDWGANFQLTDGNYEMVEKEK